MQRENKIARNEKLSCRAKTNDFEFIRKSISEAVYFLLPIVLSTLDTGTEK